MNTALRVVRPRTPIDVSDKAGGGLQYALNAGLSEPSFKIADLGNNFPRPTQRSEKSSRIDNSPAFIKRSPCEAKQSERR